MSQDVSVVQTVACAFKPGETYIFLAVSFTGQPNSRAPKVE